MMNKLIVWGVFFRWGIKLIQLLISLEKGIPEAKNKLRIN